MSAKEAKARIKINKLLEDAGWRFFDNEFAPANIQVEANVKLSKTQIDALGDNFEKTKNGFVDFLLLDENGKPFIVLEAKSEDYDPLAGKEQARKYAKSQFVKYVILSNGNIHYFWNIYKGSPQVIITFPTYESVKESKALNADPAKLYSEEIAEDYISLIIADESHRSISGNSRAVFEYFIGYKLGLTATPKDYLKNVDADDLIASDPRAWERRQLLDTYKTFGCESGEPTFRYSLIDGVNDPDGPYLVNPTVVDARTDITTQLLADKGYAVIILNIGLFRPIFSPTDFIQIKGRGTRTYTFNFKRYVNGVQELHSEPKETFKLFDFFGNCEYFEEKYDYDEVIKLPRPASKGLGLGGGVIGTTFENFDPDPLKTLTETKVGLQCMKIDRMFFEKFEDTVKKDATAKAQYEQGNYAAAQRYIEERLL